MPCAVRRILVRRLSSQTTAETRRKVSSDRRVMSPRFPMGVAIRKRVPGRGGSREAANSWSVGAGKRSAPRVEGILHEFDFERTPASPTNRGHVEANPPLSRGKSVKKVAGGRHDSALLASGHGVGRAYRGQRAGPHLHEAQAPFPLRHDVDLTLVAAVVSSQNAITTGLEETHHRILSRPTKSLPVAVTQVPPYAPRAPRLRARARRPGRRARAHEASARAVACARPRIPRSAHRERGTAYEP